MCLALPGKVISISDDEGILMGDVEFSNVRKKVCLSFTPDVKVNDYVIVHVGFAISRLDEAEALATLNLIEEGFSS